MVLLLVSFFLTRKQAIVINLSNRNILTIDESLEGDWIQREFFNSSLDKRLAQSLVNLARAKNNDLDSHVSNICVPGMNTYYRVKVPNSAAGGKS